MSPSDTRNDPERFKLVVDAPLGRHPALAEIQRELSRLHSAFARGCVNSALADGARLQQGAELAAALRLGIPHLMPLLPHYASKISEAADALEEFSQ